MTSLPDPSDVQLALAKIDRVLEQHRIDLSTKLLLESAKSDLQKLTPIDGARIGSHGVGRNYIDVGRNP